MKEERHKKIADFVNEHGTATVEELSTITHVSKATTRRDLDWLAKEKILFRTHGGAVAYSRSSGEEIPIQMRNQMNIEGKDLIAETAAELIPEGSTIYIGAGTTGRALAAKLGNFHHLTVLTNDLDVAREVAATDNILIVAGGQLKRNSWTLYGYFAERMLQELRVDLAFMIVDGVNMQKGFMDYNIDEANLKRTVIYNARQCVMLCDDAKFSISAFVNICPLTAVHTVVTNSETDPAALDTLMSAGIKVLQAKRKA